MDTKLSGGDHTTPSSEVEADLAKLREACERGRRLFPCVAAESKEAGDRKPAITEWQTRATTDFAQVERWYREFPGCRWGWLLEEHFVVDLDPRNGFPMHVLDNWETWFDYALPETLVQWTPGGGVHLV